jgi:hypothetical protein
MTGRTLRLRLAESPAALLITATGISALSFFFRDVMPAKPLALELIFAYFPLLFGGAAMALCILAINRAAHKRLVVLYAVILAPFAFRYSVWMIIVWILYAAATTAPCLEGRKWGLTPFLRWPRKIRTYGLAAIS